MAKGAFLSKMKPKKGDDTDEQPEGNFSNECNEIKLY